MSFYTFNEKEMEKLQTIEKWDKKVLEIEDVCDRFLCSKRTAYRYLCRYRALWPIGLQHWLKGRLSNNRWDKLEWIKLYALKKKYKDFWPTLLAESLIAELGRDKKSIGVEALRLKMIEWWSWVVNERKHKVTRQKRERRAKKWMMSQFDGSYHIRLENGEEICMLLSVDDATSDLMRCRFTKWESLADMIMYREWYFRMYGKPQSIYVDCHATYKVNHEQDQFDEEMKTRFTRGMQRMWVTIIFAKCPEWKGRIERSFKTHQDRMIKKMRLLWIKTIEDANKYFDEIYRQEHNQKFWVKPVEEWDMHTPMTEDESLEFKRYFALETKRVIKKDGTVWYGNKVYQIKKWETLVYGKNVIAKESIDWEIRIFSGQNDLEIISVKNRN